MHACIHTYMQDLVVRDPFDKVHCGNELFATSETYIHTYIHANNTYVQDLVVRDPSNNVHYGNELFATSETYTDYPEADDFNNVERAVFPPFVTPGQYVVRVTAPRVVTGSQM
jgi:hypothetical protein